MQELVFLMKFYPEKELHIRDQNVNTGKIFLVPIVLRFVDQGKIQSFISIRFQLAFPKIFLYFPSNKNPPSKIHR